jgi:hypothetical protein
MMKPKTARPGDPIQGTDLLDEQQFQFVRRPCASGASKIAAAPGSGMRPQADVVLLSQSDAGFHGRYITGVSAAGHIGGRDGSHQRARAR